MAHNKKDPRPAATGRGSETHEGNHNMNTVHPTAYTDYTVVMKDDAGAVFYSPCVQDESLTLRCVYSICRVPSTKEIIVRCKRGITDQERVAVSKLVDRGIVRSTLYEAERLGATFRKRREDGTYKIYGHFGKALSDPLIDLELQMIIDAGSSVTTFTSKETVR